MRTILFLVFMIVASAVKSAELVVNISNAPLSGNLVFQVYKSPNSFGDFRDPWQEIILPATGDGQYRLDGIKSGTIALLVYSDENGNGIIDKNFIGIPREPLALSNNYKPKGPPSFSRARFELKEDELQNVDLTMYRVLGNRGRWGLGLGVIGKSSPYVGSRSATSKVIPAISYFGERLQWYGPGLKYGVAGSGKLRLALSVDYRLGSYEEDDADILKGLGDRRDTLMGGVGIQYEFPYGIDVGIGYQHDLLDRIGGGIADFGISRSFQFGVFRFRPQLSFNWVSGKVNNYEFGVPADAATTLRPEYMPGSTTSVKLGVSTFVELSEDWRLIFNIAGEKLADQIVDSPIVEDDKVISGFAGFTYTF